MELSEELTPSSPYTLDISSTIATKFTCAVIFSQSSKNTQLQKVPKIREINFHKKSKQHDTIYDMLNISFTIYYT